MNIGPGVKAQDLHRDDFIWQQTHRAGNEEKTYTLGSDVAVGLLIPGVKTTAANGATLVMLLLAQIVTEKVSSVRNAHLAPGRTGLPLVGSLAAPEAA